MNSSWNHIFSLDLYLYSFNVPPKICSDVEKLVLLNKKKKVKIWKYFANEKKNKKQIDKPVVDLCLNFTTFHNRPPTANPDTRITDVARLWSLHRIHWRRRQKCHFWKYYVLVMSCAFIPSALPFSSFWRQ